MKPVILFYKEDSYLYSSDFTQLSCQDDSWPQFLKMIEKEYHSHMKVVKVNYEAGAHHLLQDSPDQHKLYDNNLIDILVLNSYEVISSAELSERLSTSGKEFKREVPFSPLVDKSTYLDAISVAHDGIKKGDIYQLNLTIPFKGKWSGDSVGAFKYFHSQFHGNFHAHIPLKEGALISMSPELFIEKENTKLTTMPIKGTGTNSEIGIRALQESDKENAELSMIVDLLRNDLNSVSDIEGSKVTAHREIMNLGDIVHTYSTIESRSSSTLPDILPATLPGGSISGCPKKRALSYISKVEPYQRGFYTGTLGWWKEDDFRLNILIRSFMLLNSGDVYYHAGGGIVFDSNFEKEYDEVLLKSQRINQ